MANSGVVVRNWRDPDPTVSHDNAIVWSVLTQPKEGNPDPSACLSLLRGFTRHALQGRKNSDNHQHKDAEQYYYILSGKGEVLIDGKKYPVSEGSVAYSPPQIPHQLLAEGEDEWVEHLVVTCAVQREGSRPRVVNWRDVAPHAGEHGGAVIWHLLESVDEEEATTDQPCLLGMYYIVRQGLVRGKASDYHVHDDKEQIYYVIEGCGTMIAGDEVHRVSEGDTIYLPPNVYHKIINDDYDGWLSYLVIS